MYTCMNIFFLVNFAVGQIWCWHRPMFYSRTFLHNPCPNDWMLFLLLPYMWQLRWKNEDH